MTSGWAGRAGGVCGDGDRGGGGTLGTGFDVGRVSTSIRPWARVEGRWFLYILLGLAKGFEEEDDEDIVEYKVDEEGCFAGLLTLLEEVLLMFLS